MDAGADALGQPTGLLTGFGYGAAQPNRSFGRLATAAGPVVAPLAEPSLGSVAPENPAAFRLGRGAANGPVQRGPLMITELMVNPASGTEPEWIEIQNLSDRPLPLGGAVALNGLALVGFASFNSDGLTPVGWTIVGAVALVISVVAGGKYLRSRRRHRGGQHGPPASAGDEAGL